MVRFLRHPAYLPTVGTLLLLFGMVRGSITALLGAACCLYLAWHGSRQRASQSESAGESRVERYPRGMRRVVQIALLIGLFWGGVQAYFRLVDLGWDRLFALVGAGGIVGSLGVVLWLVTRALVRPRT
jgi:hypothetical protein